MRKFLYSVVVPLYNEEEVLNETYKRLKRVMDDLNEEYEIVLINDGSRDKTAELVDVICNSDEKVKYIEFSRNFGHQTAVTAGMDYADGDAIIVIDADLQDPPEIIPEMIKLWKDGFDVVYGQRTRRNGETIFKKLSAKIFYRFLKSMTEVDIPLDTGDFRLIDRKVCNALKLVNENNRFIRGIISWLGFKQTGVSFERDKRFAGETKYPLSKMLKFAFDAITSFSYKPLKLATFLGFLTSLGGFLYLFVVIYQRIFMEETIVGWASTLAVTLIFNGVILNILGIIGEYIGRIFDEAKGRPLYLVKKTLNYEDDRQHILTRR